MPKMEVIKSKLDELLDIIRPVVTKGVKCQSNKGDVEINKTGTISEISHEPSNMDESYADEWTKVIYKGKEFELKWYIPATEEDIQAQMDSRHLLWQHLQAIMGFPYTVKCRMSLPGGNACDKPCGIKRH